MSSPCYSSLLNQQKHTFLSVFVVGLGNCILGSRTRSDQNYELPPVVYQREQCLLNARPMALSRLYVRTFDERTVLATIILTWLTIQLSSRENRRRQYKYHLWMSTPPTRRRKNKHNIRTFSTKSRRQMRYSRCHLCQGEKSYRMM